jgi:hypothetical protein
VFHRLRLFLTNMQNCCTIDKKLGYLLEKYATIRN